MTLINQKIHLKLKKLRKDHGLSFSCIAEMSGFSELEVARFEKYPLESTPLRFKMLSKYWGSLGDGVYDTMMFYSQMAQHELSKWPIRFGPRCDDQAEDGKIIISPRMRTNKKEL